jgi:hypothetical protein
MRVEDTMTKLIRIVVAGLSLCGAVAVLPGVAEARENDRAVPAHVDHGGRGVHGRWHDGRGEHGRRHDGRGEHGRRHDGRGRFERGEGGRRGC